MEPLAYLILTQGCKTLSFDIERNPEAQQIALYSIEQLIADGWRRCARGQRTTQYCQQTEVLRQQLYEAIRHIEELLCWEGAPDKYKQAAREFVNLHFAQKRLEGKRTASRQAKR